MTWCEIYRPECFADVKGQNYAVEKAKIFIENFGKGKHAVILHGPPGTGKTSLAYAIAKEINSEIFELNASDFRNREQLQDTLRPAIEQKSLIKARKIILVDEVDGLSATDRGGLLELLDLIKQTTYPIIITANHIWDRKFSSLRQKSELINLKEIDYKTIKDLLISILRKENLFVDNRILTTISIKAKGDIRAAINDLETIAKLGKQASIVDLKLDERNKENDIFNALRLIFKGKPNKEALSIFDSVNMSLDEILLWVEENIPAEYTGEELARAYDLLSKADLFKGRIYKQQYWRFLVYQNIFLSYGISSAKQEIKTGFTSYKKPTRILKIWLNNQRTIKKKSISIKYAKCVHVGEKRAMKEFPVIKQILKNKKIRQELKLSDEEIEYLEK